VVCSRCGKNKKEDEFYTRRTATGPKLRGHCKVCHMAMNGGNKIAEATSARMYYERNGEARRAYQREYYQRKKEGRA
jgi:hypothetical protein